MGVPSTERNALCARKLGLRRTDQTDDLFTHSAESSELMSLPFSLDAARKKLSVKLEGGSCRRSSSGNRGISASRILKNIFSRQSNIILRIRRIVNDRGLFLLEVHCDFSCNNLNATLRTAPNHSPRVGCRKTIWSDSNVLLLTGGTIAFMKKRVCRYRSGETSYKPTSGPRR
jgi:hypothetical protein